MTILQRIIDTRIFIGRSTAAEIENSTLGANIFDLMFKTSEEPVIIGEYDSPEIEGTVDREGSYCFYINGTPFECPDSYMSCYSIFRDIPVEHMLKFNNVGKKELLAAMEELVSSNQLYGVLITDGDGNFLNPAHPMVANEIKRRGLEYWFDGGRFTMLLFPYTQGGPSGPGGGMFDSINYDKLESVDGYSTPKLAQSSILDKNVAFGADFICGLKDIEFYIDDVDQDKVDSNTFIVVPVQTAVLGGRVIPWYGVVYKEAFSDSAFVAGPMLTPNIEIFDEGNLDAFDLDKTPLSICTGVIGGSYFDFAMARLNCANYDSAYQRIGYEGDLMMVKVDAARKSIEILKDKKDNQ